MTLSHTLPPPHRHQDQGRASMMMVAAVTLQSGLVASFTIRALPRNKHNTSPFFVQVVAGDTLLLVSHALHSHQGNKTLSVHSQENLSRERLWFFFFRPSRQWQHSRAAYLDAVQQSSEASLTKALGDGSLFLASAPFKSLTHFLPRESLGRACVMCETREARQTDTLCITALPSFPPHPDSPLVIR